jgi:arylsulfatase A-like enzyme
VGAIVETLDRLGLREDTLVVFTSDNGATREPRAGMHAKPVSDGGRNDPLRGFKFSLFDGGIRMPAVLNWPNRIPAGRVVREMCAHFDLFPTFASLAGARPTGIIDGRDILETARGNAPSPHRELFWASSGQTAARRGRWKLVLDGLLAEDGGFRRGSVDSVFLSDLETDIGERRNLTGEQPGVVADLRSAAEKWRAGLTAG